MSERYSRLFSLPENLYAEGAPVIIAAGALLKDNQTGKVIAQLKLKNVGEKGTKAAKVKFSPLDSMNRPLGDAVIHNYLDLNAQRDDEFGQKTAIALPDAASRAYLAEVIEVGFTDNSIWTVESFSWTPLEKQDKLDVAIQDVELVKQFKIEYGATATYTPKQDRDLWLCYCGAVNRKDETTCHICGGNPNYDLEALKANCKQRLEEERAEAEKEAAVAKAEAERRAAEEAAARAQKEAKAKKTKKTLAILLPSVAVVIAAALLLTLVIIPNKKYNDALALGNAGQYEQAISSLAALNGYKDSGAQIERLRIEQNNAIVYAEAEASLVAKNYDTAIMLFSSLAGFRDSEQRVEELTAFKYEAAEEFLASENYDDAIRVFNELGNYRDSAQRVEEITEQKLSKQYAEAEALLSSKDYETAIVQFKALGNYRDSSERVNEATELKLSALYAEALDYEEQGEYGTAITAFRKVLNYSDSRVHIANLVSKLQGCISISPFDGFKGILGLHTNGTVAYSGWWNNPAYRQYLNGDFSTWNDIISVSCGMFDLGLRSDGTVAIVCGNQPEARLHISSWHDIVSVSCYDCHAVGLRSNGTVVGEMMRSPSADCINVSKWSNIAAVSAGHLFTVGLKTDGTVVSTPSPSDIYGKSYGINCSTWRDIVAISAGYHHVLGLRADGTVVATGRNEQGECDVSNWTDIVAISTENYVSMGLKADGTVVVKGTDYFQLNTFDVSSWRDIVAISASGECLVGLQADGKIVLAFADKPDEYISPASNWRDIGIKG